MLVALTCWLLGANAAPATDARPPAAPPPVSTRFVATSFGVAQGLPQTSVTAIAQDDRGFLWVATFGGLARFDGRTFVRVDPKHADMDGHRFVAVACQGSTVWAGTDHGRLFRFDDYGRALPREVSLGPAHEDPIWQLVAADDGALWIAAGTAGVSVLRGAQVRHLSVPLRFVRLLALAKDGTVWGAAEDELSCLDGPCPAERLVAAPGVSALSATPDGTLRWSARAGEFELRAGAISQRATGQAGPSASDAAHGRRWLVRDGALELTTAAGLELVALPRASALPAAGPETPPHVRALFLDRAGVLWVGTDDSGLYEVVDRRVTQVRAAEGLAGKSTLLALPLDDGAALVSAYCQGLQRLEPAAPSARVTRVPGVADDACIFALAQAPDRSVWFEQRGELFRVADGQVTRRLSKAEADWGDVKALLFDGPGTLWVGTRRGLHRLDLRPEGLRVAASWREADGLADDEVQALALEPGGALLVGTRRGAMRLAQGALRRLVRPDHERTAAVRDFHVDPEGAVWLATYGEGLARVAPPAPGQEDAHREARWLSTAQGFCADELSRFIAFGTDAWINSNQGLFRVPLEDLTRAARGPAPLRCDGFASGEGNGGAQPAGGLLAGGLLVFPTTQGLALVDPQHAEPPPPPPPVFIETALADELPLELGSVTRVPPGRRDVTLRLSTPADGPDTEIERTLVHDGLPRTQIGGRLATYLSLPPGEYQFTARRRGLGGALGPPAEVRFTLEASFLETPWARLGLPALVLLLGALVARAWFRTLDSRARALEAELTERRNTENARRERDAVYRTVFDGSPVPLFLFAPDATLRQQNPAAQRMVGAAPDAKAELPFVAPEQRPSFRGLLTQAAAGEAVSGREQSFVGADGKRVAVRVEAASLKLGGEALVLVAATDVTAALEAEAHRAALLSKAAASQRLEGLGRLAAGIAHDFNNVLAALELQVDELRGPPDAEHLLRVAREMAQALATGKNLTRRFLVFGKGEAEASPLRLDDAVAAARPLLVRLLQPDVELAEQCGAAGAAVRLAPAHLDQLLLNLVVNAQDAVGARGRIRITTRLGAPSEGAEVTQLLPPPAGTVVELAVEDTGCGMDEATLARAFEPFFTTKGKQGTGMGLAVVHGIATRAGAGLAVRTKAGRGTTFYVQFPQVLGEPAVASGTAVPTFSTPAPQPAPGTLERVVLVCDDTPALREALVRLLKSKGFTVLAAEDGEQALTLFASRPVELVITDLVMPKVDGAELVRRLRAQGATVPVILLSGYPGDATEKLADVAVEPLRTLEKPFLPSVLLKAIGELLGTR